MRMLVTVEFADAGKRSGSHRVLIIGRGMQDRQPGDIGLSLEEAKTDGAPRRLHRPDRLE